MHPLLVNGKKFDIRGYMLIASSNPYLVFYHPGYIRLACEDYSLTKLDLHIHLNNQVYISYIIANVLGLTLLDIALISGIILPSNKISPCIIYYHPAGIYLPKVNNRNTRTRCEICWKLTIKTTERPQCRRSGIFIVNFEHIFTPCSSVSIVDFEHVIAGWAWSKMNGSCSVNCWKIRRQIGRNFDYIIF